MGEADAEPGLFVLGEEPVADAAPEGGAMGAGGVLALSCRADIQRAYGISEGSQRNWEKRGAAAGRPVPWERPGELAAWYREVVGQEPQRKVLERIEELTAGGQPGPDERAEPAQAGVAAGGQGRDTPPRMQEPAPPAHEAGLVDGSARVLEQALAALGHECLAAKLAREIEHAWDELQRERAAGDKAAARQAKRDWVDLVETARQLAKTPDPVDAAFLLLQRWVREELDARHRGLRRELSGARLGLAARPGLMAARTEGEFIRAWDEALEGVLKVWVDGAGEE